jgi:hypothetical protein
MGELYVEKETARDELAAINTINDKFHVVTIKFSSPVTELGHRDPRDCVLMSEWMVVVRCNGPIPLMLVCETSH